MAVATADPDVPIKVLSFDPTAAKWSTLFTVPTGGVLPKGPHRIDAVGSFITGDYAPTLIFGARTEAGLVNEGVFVARWTIPVALKGTSFVFADLRATPHLIIWGIVAGMLWAVANTLTVFAIRNVGLSVAFPLWNLNSLIGMFWGWLLFNELRGAGAKAPAR